MAAPPPPPVCPHCGVTLRAFTLPEASGWDVPFQLACFNDDCPYFRRGWAWMLDHYGVKSSYRYRLDLATGRAYPLGVWSKDALRDRIIDGDVSAPGEGSDDATTEFPSQKGSDE